MIRLKDSIGKYTKNAIINTRTMSARMEVEELEWTETAAESSDKPIKQSLDSQMESFLRNADDKNLLSPLREAQAHLSREHELREDTQAQCRAALPVQEQWNSWLDQRELLRLDIKRGKECLEQTRRELASLRASLEQWTAYERLCGKNPLSDYMEAITARERIRQFLPGWLSRRQGQLMALTRRMESCAKQHGMQSVA